MIKELLMVTLPRVELRAQNATVELLALGAGRASGFAFQNVQTRSTRSINTRMQRAPSRQFSTSHGNGSLHLPQASSPQQNGEPLKVHGSVHPHGHLQAMPHPEHYDACGAHLPHNMWPFVLPASSAKEGLERMVPIKYCGTGLSPCGSSDVCNPNTSIAGLDTCLLTTNPRGGSYSHSTEDYGSLRAATVGHMEPMWTYSHEVGTFSRQETPFKDREGTEAGDDGFGEVPDAMPSFSGESQSSAEFSAKETSSVGKQKVDEFYCQCKEAEVDSAELSHIQKGPSKRRRVAESHNLSEKRRRNRINERLRTLQELIPNFSKTDKASILDEAIEYLKALQSQLQMMTSRSGMRVSPMVLPTGMDHLKMAKMAPVHSMGLGPPYMHSGMGMGLGLGVTDFTHGTVRPLQALPPASALGNVAYPIAAPVSTQASGQSYPSIEPPSSEFWSSQKQASVQVLR